MQDGSLRLVHLVTMRDRREVNNLAFETLPLEEVVKAFHESKELSCIAMLPQLLSHGSIRIWGIRGCFPLETLSAGQV